MKTHTSGASPLIAFCLWIYRSIQATGLLQLPLMQKIFIHSYFFYKRKIEDPFEMLFKRYPGLIGNGSVLDIGANIGYTTYVFAKQLQAGNKVFSFEPDPENFKKLKDVEKIFRLKNVELNMAAVGKENGSIDLWINEDHPADHRILTDEFSQAAQESVKPGGVLKKVTVPLIAMDPFLKNKKVEVSFVKIDVQGFELEVVRGMEALLSGQSCPILALEYAPDHMLSLGFPPQDLMNFIEQKNFTVLKIHRKGALQEITDLKKVLAEGEPYCDLLLVQVNRCSKSQLAALRSVLVT